MEACFSPPPVSGPALTSGSRLTRKQTLNFSRQTSLAPRSTKKQRLHSSNRRSFSANARITTVFPDFFIQLEKLSSVFSRAFSSHFITDYGGFSPQNLSIIGSDSFNFSIIDFSPNTIILIRPNIIDFNTGFKSATILVRSRKLLPPNSLLGFAQEFLASAWEFLQFVGDKFEHEKKIKKVMNFVRNWDKFSCQIEKIVKNQ